ncbi:MAG TPA: hypothetical protein VGR62_08910 [Candidatus Binatia bacterium]|nr:hypothetical protein [Candidatus Binatia bacterium]
MRSLAAVLLVALGLAQMTGDLLGVPALRRLAAATAASPGPTMFSAVHGYEAFSTRFVVEWMDSDGDAHALALMPGAYAQLRGPIDRRNAYGAVVAYGPVLASQPVTRPLLDAAARFALCGDAPLLAALGIDPSRVTRVRLRLSPRPGLPPIPMPLVLEPSCR